MERLARERDHTAPETYSPTPDQQSPPEWWKSRILELKAGGEGMLKIGRKLGIGTSVVQRVFKQAPWQS
jgi:hypothetical protein